MRRGRLIYKEKGYDNWEVEVLIEGLEVNSHYWLCINSV